MSQFQESGIDHLQAESLLSRETPVTGAAPLDHPNPQLEIWRLREDGKIDEAALVEHSIEQILRTAAIDESKTRDVGEGQNQPKYVYFALGYRGVWKREIGKGSRSHEIAAYLLDRYLELNRVPMVIEREMNGAMGSLHLYVEHSERKNLPWDPESMSFFDAVIRSQDRHDQNYLIADGRTIAIDNGDSFEALPIDSSSIWFTKRIRAKIELYQRSRSFENSLANELQSLARTGGASTQTQFLRREWQDARAKRVHLEFRTRNELAAMLPSREAYRKLFSTTDTEWANVFSGHLTKPELLSFISRKNRVIEEIENAQAVLGGDLFAVGRFSNVYETSH